MSFRSLIPLLALGLGACRPTPAPECQRLVACAGVLIPGSAGELQQAYGPDGSCWVSRSTAKVCARSCGEALKGLETEPGFAGAAACSRR
ncbi:MAG: hypothetical protein M3Y59_09315 [Myxococcota bacterium]|nr:hypothetical protein [Myxococcota bacterium]